MQHRLCNIPVWKRGDMSMEDVYTITDQYKRLIEHQLSNAKSDEQFITCWSCGFPDIVIVDNNSKTPLWSRWSRCVACDRDNVIFCDICRNNCVFCEQTVCSDCLVAAQLKRSNVKHPNCTKK